MAKSKKQSSRSKKMLRNKRRTISRRRTNKRDTKIRGGGCGCNKSLFTGGNSLTPALNSYENDPNSPSTIVSSRLNANIKVGGKRRRMKGGSPQLIGSSIGDAYSAIGILSGVQAVNTSPTAQPIANSYGGHNIPIV